MKIVDKSNRVLIGTKIKKRYVNAQDCFVILTKKGLYIVFTKVETNQLKNFFKRMEKWEI